MTLYTTHPSPIGELLLVGEGEHLTGLYVRTERYDVAPPPTARHDQESFGDAIAQLDAYFAGELREFDLPLAPEGTPFQQLAWQELQRIPYGETISYGEQARRIGKPEAARAVGHANGRNPISIVIPCHRVIGSSGDLTGYGWGIARKRALLDLEAGLLPLTAA